MSVAERDPAWLRRRIRKVIVEPACARQAGVERYDPERVADAPREAAVLVALVLGLAPGVLLTLRCAHLAAHPGQVSFPGGRADAGDSGPEETALREAAEEVALDAAHVELVGRLRALDTTTGFHVTPVLGLLPESSSIEALGLRPAAGEVDALFTLPLAVLLDPGAPRIRHAILGGRSREFWVWPHPEHYIWGVTATILVDLAARLRAVLCSD